jgi:hypothetical protein
LYDLSKDSFADLAFVGTANVTPAVLTPVIVDGKIITVNIADSGSGYKVVPTYKIIDPRGTGLGAELTLTINVFGQVTSVTVNRSGSNYSSNNSVCSRTRHKVMKTNSQENGK